MHPNLTIADWRIAEWIPSHGETLKRTPDAESLRGRVVVVLAFQMLCPGCVANALPLAMRAHRLFPRERVAILGMHTVFEHHDAMTPTALRAFMHEYRVPFPVAVDRPGTGGHGIGAIPQTMRAFEMRGTPTWLLFDAQGALRRQVFGEIDALALGAEVAALMLEPQTKVETSVPASAAEASAGDCDDDACAVPPTGLGA